MVNRDLLGMAIDAKIFPQSLWIALGASPSRLLNLIVQGEIQARTARLKLLVTKISEKRADLRLAIECRQNARILWPFQYDLDSLGIETKRLRRELLLLRGIISPFYSLLIAVGGIDYLIGRGRVGGLA